MEELLRLYEDWRGCAPQSVEQLPGAGSNRTYYRFWDAEGDSLIGVVGTSREENEAFIYLAGHFGQKRLPMPRVVAVSTSRLCYLQTDLGHRSLFDALSEGREKGGRYAPEEKELLRRTIAELPRIQFVGAEGLDFGRCYPMASMDRTAVFFDLNYFKYCFLKLAGVEADEDRLEDDFDRLTAKLVMAGADGFMFRDFQSRNIMVLDNEVYFIDYQGGRQGALHYDVASLLYDAIVKIPENQKEELLDFYIRELTESEPGYAEKFREIYYHFVLVRLLQAMGAFGLRGLHEGKPHFIDSIVPGLQGISTLFESGKLEGEYPEIQYAIRMAFEKYFVPLHPESKE